MPRFASAAALAAALLLSASCNLKPDPTLEQLAYQNNDHLSEVLRAEVQHPIRVQRALTVAERIRFSEEYYFEKQRGLDEELFELNAGYDTPRADFYDAFERIHALRDEASDDLVGLYVELKGHLTADEWRHVVDATRADRERMLDLLR